jgi:AraC family transcriptional regulator, arabinose operon regulatory protein
MKKDYGFEGEIFISIPAVSLDESLRNPLNNLLHITHIGYFPYAKYHYRERSDGAPQHILIYCANGKGMFSTASKTFKVKSNQYFILPKHDYCLYAADRKEPWSIYWIHFDGSYSDYFVKSPVQPIDIPFTEERINLFHDLYKIYETGFKSQNLFYANMCLWRLLGSFSARVNLSRQISSPKEKAIEESIEYMKDNMDKCFNLDYLSRKFGYSPSHYIKLFKEETGHSPIDFLINIKMQKACSLLNMTSASVKSISLMLGYKDQYYFSRLFKQVIGQSPSEYKKVAKG